MDHAAPLEPAGKEVDTFAPARGVADVDLPEIVLAELARHALESDQRGHGRRPQPAHQFVDGTLAAAILVLLAQPAEDLNARQRVIFPQPGLDPPRPWRGDRRSADPPGCDQGGGLARGDRGLVFDAPHAPDGDVGGRGDSSLGHVRCPQDLDLMPAHGVDHPFPSPGAVASRAAPGKSLSSLPETGQLFRKGRGQSFRNLHRRVRGRLCADASRSAARTVPRSLLPDSSRGATKGNWPGRATRTHRHTVCRRRARPLTVRRPRASLGGALRMVRSLKSTEHQGLLVLRTRVEHKTIRMPRESAMFGQTKMTAEAPFRPSALPRNERTR